ncbi:MAG: tyrosine--tRNA ligase [Bacilli bacterium]|nr:tyrosine--tRNA ligase [Bacilli bacterium]
MTCFEDLMYRGLIKDVASEDIEKVLNGEPITFYWGTDPTADSLTVGHYSSLITAKRLAKYGHHPILLVGGATGLIGDPRPTAEREIISKEKLDGYFQCIKKQVSDIFDGNVEIVNNYDWFKDISWIDFLRDVGKYINVNYMLNKDIISRRLESGITFAEFAYTLMQGYDYLYLNETKNVTLQCAGSDQWGNITTGVELINKKLGKQVNAFTMPLIVDSTGKKIGKSEGNAIWLDENKTSSYELYQYFINTTDDKVYEYLKVFTFLTKDEIEELMEKHNAQPELRLAQKELAKQIIIDLHGEESFNRAISISESLFSGDIKSFTSKEVEEAFKGIDPFEISSDLNIVDLLVEASVCSSKREAREFISNGSITLNGEKITDLEFIITKSICIDSKYLVVRRGKKKYFVGIYK